MKRKSTLCRSIIAFVIMAMLLSLTAFADYNVEVEEQTSEFYVNDFANIIAEEDKQAMMENAVKLAEEYDGIQVVVSTVSSLKGYQIEEYGYAMYEKYGIGKDSMGILILLSVEDRQVSIETGKTMQAYITDSKSGQLLDNYGMSYFSENRFSEGLKSLQSAVITEIRSVVPIGWSSDVQETTTAKHNNSLTLIVGFFVLLFLMPIVIIIILLVTFRRKYVDITTYAKQLQEENDKLSGENNNLKELKLQNSDRIKELERSDASLRELADSLDKDNDDLIAEIRKLEAELTSTKEFYARVRKLHPELNFEKEVEAMIEAEAMEEASKIDKKLNSVVRLTADKNNVEAFESAIKAYNSAETKVQNYVKEDIAKVRTLYHASVELRKAYEKEQQELHDKAEAKRVYEQMNKVFQDNNVGTYEEYDALYSAYMLYEELTYAQRKFFPDEKMLTEYELVLNKAREDKQNHEAARKAEEAAKNAISSIYGSADEDDRNKISNAYRHYNNLSMAQRAYFDAELLGRMNRLKREADDDHERCERRREQERRREEARRREQMRHSSSHSSSSSFGGGSHHSGFGGHSSGGGASRGF